MSQNPKTINEFLYAIRELLNVQSDDSTVNNRFVYFLLKSVRSVVMAQEADKDRLWGGSKTQLIEGFELERSTISESDEFEADLIVFRSVKPLPQFIDMKTGPAIFNIFFNNGVQVIPTEYIDWMAASKRRFNPPQPTPKYFIRNAQLCVVDYNPLAQCIILNLEGLLESPEETLEPCGYIGDLELKMPAFITSRVLSMTADLVRSKYGIPADTRNNGKEDIGAAPQQPQNPQR